MTDKAPQITQDERIEALLIGAEQQAELAKTQGDAVGELVATLEGLTAQVAQNHTQQTNTTTEQHKQFLLRLENLSNKVVTENTLTKNEMVNLIANTVNSFFVRNLSTQLAQETKDNIQNALNDVVGGLISKTVDKDLSDLKAEIQQIRQELRATANDTKQIAVEVSQRLRAGADEIVGEGVEQILQGVQSATDSYQNTVSNLEQVATLSTKKSKVILEGIDNLYKTLRGQHLWFTGAFCGIWFLVCLIGSGIYTHMNKATDEQRQEHQQLIMSNQALQSSLATINYEYKDNKLYVPVDRNDCHDSFGKNFCLKK